MSWRADKAWSDRFIPTITAILGQTVFRVAPEIEDQRRNSDLLVLRANEIRVACRVRRFRNIERYEEEFTLRRSRASGVETELSKVLSGWGDFMLYAFANGPEDGLACWKIGDLSVFRRWMAWNLERAPGFVPEDFGQVKDNWDGGSTFVAYNWEQIDNETGDFVVAAGEGAVVTNLVRWHRGQVTA